VNAEAPDGELTAPTCERPGRFCVGDRQTYRSCSLFSQYLIFFSRYVNRIMLRFEVIRNAPLTAIPGTTD
jgi:hypothetical protein